MQKVQSNPLYEVLRRSFRDPIVILMLGDWRTGKTDTSLLVAYLAKKWGLIDKIGSNIWTFNNPLVEYLDRFSILKRWLHADTTTKLVIFDEALKHLYRRKAMSEKNVEIITEILPELSKGHARIIFCSQIEKLDTDAIHPAFCRAIWRKKTKKVMTCVSKHYPPQTFTGLPRSPIRFDPDRTAPFFIDKDMSKGMNLENDDGLYEIVQSYVMGSSYRKIMRDKGVHPEEIRRAIRKVLKWYLDKVHTFPEERRPKLTTYEKRSPVKQKA